MRRMQSRVEGKRFLEFQRIGTRRNSCRKDQIPAMRGDSARDRDEAVLPKQVVPEGLLTRSGDAWVQPVRVGYACWIDDMDNGGIGDDGCRHHMRDRIERPKPLVHRNLEDCRRWIERAVDRANPLAVPASSNPICAFPAIPCRRMDGLIEPPCDQLGPAERNWQKGHA